jgi:(E)-4-hydroxy-3-methylbut-2-enyl-diphosphate synthase
MITRKKTRQITVGAVAIGGNAPVSIQSMTNTKTTTIDACCEQITRLVKAGCSIVRLAIPDIASVKAFKEIRKRISIPLVADIHFNYLLAIGAIEAGADKIRINPGNIGSPDRVQAVVDAAKQAKIPVRIGVNSGSLEKDLLEKYHGPTPTALVQSALGYIRMMENLSFDNLIISIKAADVQTTIEACRLYAQQSDYPQHIGITESGTIRTGSIRSSVGLGVLLADGIGDTIRVSLSGDPVEEVYVAKEILKSLNLATGPVVIACPTCGRTDIDISILAEKVEAMVASITVPIKIAVMGCIVNGPGEAREADVGIAGGKGKGVIFLHGKEVAQVAEEDLLSTLWSYVEEIIREKTTHQNPLKV